MPTELDAPSENYPCLGQLDLPLERDAFLRSLIRELTGTLEDVIGIDDASGFISLVGQNIGDQLNNDLKLGLVANELSREEIADVLVDLKRRIQGDFFVIHQDNEKVVLGNNCCPFAEEVTGRNSMCMMTSNVFGIIAAENLGYAKVELQKTIAKGNSGCRVVVYLTPTEEAEAADGREYFKSTR